LIKADEQDFIALFEAAELKEALDTCVPINMYKKQNDYRAKWSVPKDFCFFCANTKIFSS